ncbi:hypothetical protein FQN54_007970 [Arachnomyces sp. PD_36]|nr:hypothetical protein FQN54_007970 [Arachnomyces sp. PD_36]
MSQEIGALNEIYSWVARSILPSEEYAYYYDGERIVDGHTEFLIHDKYKLPRAESTVGISILGHLDRILPIRETQDPPAIIAVLAAFTCQGDPWTTPEACTKACAILALTVPYAPTDKIFLADLLGNILAHTVTPAFSRNKNLTPGRRFESTLSGQEDKPWKKDRVYAVTVLHWVLSQYPPSDKKLIEGHFNLLYRPVLMLIRDHSSFFRVRGCDLLSQLLAPIEASGSEILSARELGPQFQADIKPVLHSLPSLTSEDESLRLLSAAYPALLLVIRATYPLPYGLPKIKLDPMDPVDRVPIYGSDEKSNHRQSWLKNVLAEAIIPSYRHIGSSSAAENTSISSFPYPRLSTFLLSQICLVLRELGIYSCQYTQGLMPLLSAALTNPFGTSFLPLLAAAVETLRCLILNAWPTISGYRGEILEAVGSCWINLMKAEGELSPAPGGSTHKNGSEENAGKPHDLGHANMREGIEGLMVELRDVIKFLKVVVDFSNANFEGASNGNRAFAINFMAELDSLAEADPRLRLLFTIGSN